MDEETERVLAGIIERIIKRYTALEEKIDSCKGEFKALNKDMRDAAIILRDKQTWRIQELDEEVKRFASRMESKVE